MPDLWTTLFGHLAFSQDIIIAIAIATITIAKAIAISISKGAKASTMS